MSLAGGIRGFWSRATMSIKVIVIVLFLGLVANIIGAFSQKPSQPAQAPAPRAESPVDQCTKRGLAYFESLGSSPRLSDGRLASDVAKERCLRTLTAF
jgi:hypothetical protein